MISYSDALQAVLSTVSPLDVVSVQLPDALHRVLAADVLSPINLPRFDNSAMDGYAFRWNEQTVFEPMEVIGSIPAGSHWDGTIPAGCAVRIFTGSPIPAGVDTVVQQEWVSTSANAIQIEAGKPMRRGMHIRRQGEECLQGDMLLPKQTVLTPAALGTLAGVGLASVLVYRDPVVHVLVTGNELQQAGNDLLPGQIYESNSFTLQAALQEMGLSRPFIRRLSDDADQVLVAMKESLQTADFLILTGGISVGDHDVVRQTYEQAGIQRIFYKVKQKPGKPLLFGVSTRSTMEATATQGRLVYVLGLPGNPASVLSCFYGYVYPAIRRALGFSTCTLSVHKAILEGGYSSPAGLTRFLKARYSPETGSVELLEGQGSHMMASFAKANALVKIPEEISELGIGGVVELWLLPG